MSANLKYQHPGVQFAVLLGLAVGMFLLSGVITISFFGDVATAMTSSDTPITDEALKQFKWAQLIGTIVSFVVPALMFAYLCSERPIQYVGLRKQLDVPTFFIVMILLVAVQPFALYLGQVNENIHFGSLHDEIKRTEVFYERAMQNFTRMKNGMDLFVNLLIIGLLPAIAEELFFRGALQNVLERWIKIPWVAIFISSLMFAFLHGTMFKLLPIFVLGVVLGTLFYVTRNLWYCVFFHFLNNALAVIVTYYASENESFKKLAENDMKFTAMAAGISLAITAAFFIVIRKTIPFSPLGIPREQEHFNS
jgi:membrane protease YdiL (CAAX protease family)